MRDTIVIQPASDGYTRDAVQMWRDSKERAIGQPEEHDFASHMYFYQRIMPVDNEIYLAIDTTTNKPVAMMAVSAAQQHLDQLYVHIDYQGQGIGTALLDLAKQRSPARLTLHTFDVNTEAQRFYEQHSFRIIGRGVAPQEQLPDVEYEWLGVKEA